MTDGAYLTYSHESFLQNFIAIELFRKTKHWVYIDPSRRKVRESLTNAGRKPKPESLKQRFDLVVWPKVGSGVKAVIEIKETQAKHPVLRDVKKVHEFLVKTFSGKKSAAGYVLYYTDKSRALGRKKDEAQTIGARFERVDREMRDIVGTRSLTGIRHGLTDYVHAKDSQDPWGFALFRC